MHPVDFLPSWLAEALFWVYYNQTLIAGGAATAAAMLTISELRKQDSRTEKARVEEHLRRHRMLRAGLPPALSSVTEYAENCLRLFLSYLNDGGVLEMPPLPSKAYRNVQAVVETADDPVAKDLERLLRFAQIQHARLRKCIEDSTDESPELPQGRPSENERRRIYSLILDAMFLHNSVSRLYKYARGDRDDAESWRDELTAENLLLVFKYPEGGFVPGGEPLVQYVQSNWMTTVERYGTDRSSDMVDP